MIKTNILWAAVLVALFGRGTSLGFTALATSSAGNFRGVEGRLEHGDINERTRAAFIGPGLVALDRRRQREGGRRGAVLSHRTSRGGAGAWSVGVTRIAGETRRGALAQASGLRGAVGGPSGKVGELILKEVKQVDGIDINIQLEGLGGNRRRISGGLFIEAPPRAIWDVLTNYNSLNEYIPNIAESGAILQPNGKIRIEQVGVISPTLRITTRIVLEVTEEPYKTLTFSKVESREFIEFEGIYSIIETQDGRSYLEYSVEALPLPILPIQIVQGKIKKEVPPMLAAVRTNANKYHALRCSTLGENWMEDVPIPVSTAYKRRIGSQDPISDDRARFTSARPDDISAYTLPASARPSLPFSSIAAGLLQALIGTFKLLPGFKPLPGDDRNN